MPPEDIDLIRKLGEAELERNARHPITLRKMAVRQLLGRLDAAVASPKDQRAEQRAKKGG